MAYEKLPKTYKEWEALVNSVLLRRHGVGIDDIPDMPWHDWYKEPLSYKEAAQKAIDIVNEGLWV
jgi:hypothetical protein